MSKTSIVKQEEVHKSTISFFDNMGTTYGTVDVEHKGDDEGHNLFNTLVELSKLKGADRVLEHNRIKINDLRDKVVGIL